MALSTYAELKTSITQYAKRSGLDATDFVTLCEQRIKYGGGVPGESFHTEPLRLQVMEASTTLTLSAGDTSVSLPSGWLEFSSPPHTTQDRGNIDMEYLTPRQLSAKGYGLNNNTTFPTYYTVMGRELVVPESLSSDQTIYIDYYTFSALSDSNQANVVLLNYPAIYLFGSLLEVAVYTKTDADAQRYFAAYMTAVHGANQSDAMARIKGSTNVIRPDGITP